MSNRLRALYLGQTDFGAGIGQVEPDDIGPTERGHGDRQAEHKQAGDDRDGQHEHGQDLQAIRHRGHGYRWGKVGDKRFLRARATNLP